MMYISYTLYLNKTKMAKDPAVLLYTQDFLVGTMTMDFQQKGKYIHLLCLQHQKNKLTLKDLQTVLTDEDVDVFEKFPLNSDGFYYNVRMYEESVKRKNYSESRRNNRSKKTNELDINKLSKSYVQSYDTTYVPHMENENEDENEDVNVIVNETEIKNVNDNEVVNDNDNQYMFNKHYSVPLDNKEVMNKFEELFGNIE